DRRDRSGQGPAHRLRGRSERADPRRERARRRARSGQNQRRPGPHRLRKGASMFANSQMGGSDFGIPDVCLTPLTPPLPEPIPYPNFGLGPMGFPAAYNVLFDLTPAHTLATVIPLTLGDQPGIELGVMSGEDMGTSERFTGMFTCLLDGQPATRV